MAMTTYYLSQLINKPVLDPHDQPVGKLGDLVVRLGNAFPPVTGLVLRLGATGRGGRPLATFMQWSQVATVTAAGIKLAVTHLDLQAFRRRPGELLLEADLLDQQVMDLHGRKLVRVNDVQLVANGSRGADLRLAGIDVGAFGLLRRLDLSPVGYWLTSHTPVALPDRVIPWEHVEPVDWSELPAELAGGLDQGSLALMAGGATGTRGLRLTHEKLASLHPADVAELVAQLAAPDRAMILGTLDAETAAEALGEMEPDMQGDVLEDLSTRSAVDILAELPPDEAADALAEVSPERAEELLSGLASEDAEAVRELMAYPEDVAGGMMSNAYVALAANLTVQETIDTLRHLAPPAEEIYYVYVVDQAEHLTGALSLRDLIVAQPAARLAEISQAYEDIVRVPVDLPREEVIHVMEKYNLLAVPVTDEEGRLVGVITVDDALEAAVPPEERRRVWARG